MNLNPQILIRFLILAIAFAAISSQPVRWIDTGFYHYGMIQWLTRFGTVPGVALLYSHFGLTSSWFALAAPLNPEILDTRGSAILNGFVALIAGLHVWLCLAQIHKQQGCFSDWFIVVTGALLFPLLLVANTLSVIWVSPSPDFPIVFLSVVIAWLLLVMSEQPRANLSGLDERLIPIVLAAGAVAIKLTALPLLGLSSLFLAVSKGARLQRSLIGLTIVGLILAPLIFSKIITSACPLYPSTAFCLALPWSLTTTTLTKISSATHNWASWYGIQPASLGDWIALGWTWLTSKKVNQLILGSGCFALLYGFYLVKRSRQSRIQGQLWALSVGVSGIAFLMSMSPLFRFQAGYVGVVLGAVIADRCDRLYQLNGNRLNAWFALKTRYRTFTLRFFITSLIVVVFLRTNTIAHAAFPPRLPTVEVVQRQVNDIVYFYPNEPKRLLCWTTPLSCTSEKPKNIQLRDPNRGIGSGFVRADAQTR